MQYRRGKATAPLRIALVLVLTLPWPGVAAAQAACEAETAGLKALARSVQLEITARGKRLTVPSIGTVESAIKRLMSTWTAGELTVTRRALMAIAEELDGSPTGTKPRRTR